MADSRSNPRKSSSLLIRIEWLLLRADWDLESYQENAIVSAQFFTFNHSSTMFPFHPLYLPTITVAQNFQMHRFKSDEPDRHHVSCFSSLPSSYYSGPKLPNASTQIFPVAYIANLILIVTFSQQVLGPLNISEYEVRK